MRWIVLSFALIIGAAQSQEPAPTPAKAIEQPKAESKSGKKNAVKDERGTEKSPLVIKGIPTERDKKETERETEERKEKTTIDRGIRDFTGLAALATFLLFIAATFQIVLFVWQLRLIRASLKDAKVAADAARVAADATTQANKLSKDIFVSTERPWVTADIAVGGPLQYNVNGLNITLLFMLKNIGHSPATNVSVDLRLVAPAIGIDAIYNPTATLREMVAQSKSRPLAPWGHLLFPSEPLNQQISTTIGKDELARITQKAEFIHLTAIGCITYGFVFDAGLHHTGFILDIRRSDTPRPESTAKNRHPAAIFPDEGDIAAEELRLFRSFMGATAD